MDGIAADVPGTFGLGIGLAPALPVNAPEASNLPIGFDAVLQSSWRLLQRELVTNLQARGLLQLGVRVPYDPERVPEAVRAAVGQLRIEAFSEVALELQLLNPILTTLDGSPASETEGTVISVGLPTPVEVAASASLDASREYHVAIAWTLVLNLVRISTLPDVPDVSAAQAGPEPAAPALIGALRVPPSGEISQASGNSVTVSNESRVLLDQANVTMTLPGQVTLETALLRTWFELGLTRIQLAWTPGATPLAVLLGSPVGQSLIRTLLSDMVTTGSLPLSPLFAFAGDVGPQVVSSMALPTMHVAHAVHPRPSGEEVLSIGLNLGDDAVGTSSSLRVFIDDADFGYCLSTRLLAPVLRTRWPLWPSALEYISNIPAEMPLNAGSDDTGQGLLRVRVNLGDELLDVALTAVTGPYGDVLQLECQEKVQLLKAWWGDGTEVSDLGALAVPATMPLITNVAPFTPLAQGEVTGTPFRAFVRYVLDPVAFPMVSPPQVNTVGGWISEALGLVLAHWSLPTIDKTDPVGATGFSGSQVE